MVTHFHAMTPKQAIEVIGKAGVEDPATLIRDHAAAGLVKSYAQQQITIDAWGDQTAVRGAAIEAHVWERMIREGVDCDAWNGGTVRLPGSDLVGGESTIHVTGITFNPADIRRLADQQRPPLQPTLKRPSTSAALDPVANAPTTAAVEQVTETRTKRRPNTAAIPPGAILCTVNQDKEALGIGHMKVYELLKAGRLTRTEGVAGTRITLASVRALAGAIGM